MPTVATRSPWRVLREARFISTGGFMGRGGEIVAQIWIHHAIAHAYEAGALWPIS